MMYYRRALMLQSYLERRYLGGGYIVFDICYFSNQHLSYIYILILAALSGIEDGNSAAEYIDTQGYELSPDARAQADIKFTYVVSCQIYGLQKQTKKQEAADIALLLQRLYCFLPLLFAEWFGR